MPEQVILVLLSNARELEEEDRRSEIVEALRPLHTVPNALDSEAPTVVYTEQGNRNATIALAVDVPEGEDLQAPVARFGDGFASTRTVVWTPPRSFGLRDREKPSSGDSRALVE